MDTQSAYPSSIRRLKIGGQHKVAVREAGNLGFGVIALQDIAAGEVIAEITGESVHRRTRYTIQVGRHVHLDAGAPGKYLNHSCNPNAYLRLVADGLLLTAKRPITAGEAVTFDYATSERTLVSSGECLCNEPNCRKVLLGYAQMDAAWKEHNKHYVLPHLLEPQESLDPSDWPALRQLAHRMIDDIFAYQQTVRERPVWRPLPEQVKAQFQQAVPLQPEGAEQAYQDFLQQVMPYPMGNMHPHFFAWVMGNGTPLGMLADMLAAGINSDVGGGHHAPGYVQHQVINWCKAMVGYPSTASGALVSGSSEANLICLTVARNVKAEGDMRQAGLQGAPHRMTLYASHETHSSVQKAVEILGLGNGALRRIPVDADHKIDIAALEQVIAADRATGYYPFCIVGNAGTVNVGAFDDLNGLADISEREGLWFHVDGAFGAMAALSPALRHLVAGIERADSLTFDLHKWLHMPMGVGCALMRCEECHRRTFALTPAYFDHADDEQSLTGGPAWFADYGIELTQHFRALKVWMSLKAHGLQKYRRLIEQNTAQAHYLASLIDATPELQRLAPVPLNIVCLRFRPDGMGEASLARLNREILIQLHQSGAFALSSTVIHGTYALRVAICNHRSRLDDFEELVSDVVRTGQALALHQASQGKHIFAAAVLANPHMG